MNKLKRIPFTDIDITGGMLADKQKLNSETTIFAVQDRFEETGRFEAFRFSWSEGCDHDRPHFFWDSDVAKWMEAAAYILAKKTDAKLEAALNELIGLIEKNQGADGYFNIYFTVVEPEGRFQDRDHHELYCLGHLIEAAVALKQCRNDDRLIVILDRYIDYVDRLFRVERSVPFSTPGHEEIEIALLRLYAIRPEKKYLDLAMFFLNERGTKEEQLQDWMKPCYNQSHLPVRQQREAFGHSVRAGYLYTAMAQAAGVTQDEELLIACRDIFSDIVDRKMYISGGIGSTNRGEAFTIPYDLSSDHAYTESCAGIALAFFANRMKDIDLDAKYADVIERLIYNGIMSALSVDGNSFFYENPLEINVAERTRFTATHDGCEFPPSTRSRVFGCSCCPPNITRFLASLGDFMLSASDDTLYVHQFAELTAKTELMDIRIETKYPLDGAVTIIVSGGKGRKLAVRRPGWCEKVTAEGASDYDKGYLYFDVTADKQIITVEFEIEPRWVAADPRVRHCAGKTALMRGPLLYCAEKCDNGLDLWRIQPDVSAQPELTYDRYFGNYIITAAGTYTEGGAKLYSDLSSLTYKDVVIRFIPYACFANRGETDMRVWFDYRR